MEKLGREFQGAGTKFEAVSRRVLVRSHTHFLLSPRTFPHSMRKWAAVRRGVLVCVFVAVA